MDEALERPTRVSTRRSILCRHSCLGSINELPPLMHIHRTKNMEAPLTSLRYGMVLVFALQLQSPPERLPQNEAADRYQADRLGDVVVEARPEGHRVCHPRRRRARLSVPHGEWVTVVGRGFSLKPVWSRHLLCFSYQMKLGTSSDCCTPGFFRLLDKVSMSLVNVLPERSRFFINTSPGCTTEF